MYACSGLDDERLADWSYISGQGVSGGVTIDFVRSFDESQKVDFRVFSFVKSVAPKSIKLWHKHFTKMRRKVPVRYLCKVCVTVYSCAMSSSRLIARAHCPDCLIKEVYSAMLKVFFRLTCGI